MDRNGGARAARCRCVREVNRGFIDRLVPGRYDKLDRLVPGRYDRLDRLVPDRYGCRALWRTGRFAPFRNGAPDGLRRSAMI
jgi:hypothetical protein